MQNNKMRGFDREVSCVFCRYTRTLVSTRRDEVTGRKIRYEDHRCVGGAVVTTEIVGVDMNHSVCAIAGTQGMHDRASKARRLAITIRGSAL